MHFPTPDGKKRFVALWCTTAVSLAIYAPIASAQDSATTTTTTTLAPAGAAPAATDATTTIAPTTSILSPEPASTTTAAPTTTEAPTTTVLATTTAPTTIVTTVAPTSRPTTSKPTTRKKTTKAASVIPRGGTSIEVDISSQRLTLYKGGKVYRTLPVSTGTGRRYCEKGSCGVARTPRGRFRIYNRINGWRTSRLGRLYNPLYFRGGFAIHGGAIPGYPASHGCVRIPMSAARWFPSAVPNGTTVWIHD